MKTALAIVLMVAGFAAAAQGSFQDSVQPAPPVHPALYSFADLYRLTTAGAPIVASPAADAAVRVAAAPPSPAPETQFSVVRLPEPRGWMLLLAGLALAGWVARRRLGYSF